MTTPQPLVPAGEDPPEAPTTDQAPPPPPYDETVGAGTNRTEDALPEELPPPCSRPPSGQEADT
jgi:hypothetical protein